MMTYTPLPSIFIDLQIELNIILRRLYYRTKGYYIVISYLAAVTSVISLVKKIIIYKISILGKAIEMSLSLSHHQSIRPIEPSKNRSLNIQRGEKLFSCYIAPKCCLNS